MQPGRVVGLDGAGSVHKDEHGLQSTLAHIVTKCVSGILP